MNYPADSSTGDCEGRPQYAPPPFPEPPVSPPTVGHGQGSLLHQPLEVRCIMLATPRKVAADRRIIGMSHGCPKPATSARPHKASPQVCQSKYPGQVGSPWRKDCPAKSCTFSLVRSGSSHHPRWRNAALSTYQANRGAMPRRLWGAASAGPPSRHGTNGELMVTGGDNPPATPPRQRQSTRFARLIQLHIFHLDDNLFPCQSILQRSTSTAQCDAADARYEGVRGDTRTEANDLRSHWHTPAPDCTAFYRLRGSDVGAQGPGRPCIGV